MGFARYGQICWKGDSNLHGRFIPFFLKGISGHYFRCKFRLSGWNGDLPLSLTSNFDVVRSTPYCGHATLGQGGPAVGSSISVRP